MGTDTWRIFLAQPWLSEAARRELGEKRKEMEWVVERCEKNPLHHRLFLFAVQYRMPALVADLLANGASARVQPYREPDDFKDSADDHEFMPLMSAVSASPYPFNPGIFDLLLEAGADPLEPVKNFTAASPMAAAVDSTEALGYLLRRGYSPDMTLRPHPESAQWAVFLSNETALIRICRDSFDKHTKRHQKRAALRLLLDAGADLEQINPFGGCTPLLIAAEHHQEILGVLYRRGANLEARDPIGRGVMEILEATKEDRPRMKDALLAMQAKIAAANASRIDLSTRPTQTARAGARL